MLIRRFSLEGLGHLSTLVADETAGLAVVVDPRRDVDGYLAAAAELDVRISHVLETHLHNDYVSGGLELVAATGAEQVIGAGAELHHAFHGVRQGESLAVGALRFDVLETPGHTPEHVAYAVADTHRAEEPILMFTGGSLLVGAVGRTDLLGVEHAHEYARAMHHSLHDVVLRHEDFVGVYPTHGAGSLCSTGISSMPESTIGFERRHDPLLRIADPDAFARALLAGQPTFPRYFARMRPTNQAGPRVLGPIPPPRPMSPPEVRDALAGGALLVDLRSPEAHAAAHVPASLSIPAGSSFGTWLGWVVPDPDRPIVLVLERPEDWDDATRQARRIGFDDALIGHLQGGVGAWAEAGLPVRSGGRADIHQLARAVSTGGDGGPLVIDVRQPDEFESGHVPGASSIGAGELPDQLSGVPREHPIFTICASGYRASVAASLLRAAGFEDVTWVAGGVPTWAAQGYPLEYGEPLRSR
jgi:hydroxyacylglutathione hydrolase